MNAFLLIHYLFIVFAVRFNESLGDEVLQCACLVSSLSQANLWDEWGVRVSSPMQLDGYSVSFPALSTGFAFTIANLLDSTSFWLYIGARVTMSYNRLTKYEGFFNSLIRTYEGATLYISGGKMLELTLTYAASKMLGGMPNTAIAQPTSAVM